MEEEQDFDEGLEHVHEVIASCDVLQLVRENHSHLFGGERGECRGRHEDQRLQPADDHRGVDGVTHHHREPRMDADLRFQGFEHLDPAWLGLDDADDPESSHLEPLTRQTNGHDHDSGDPTPGDHRDRREARLGRTGRGVACRSRGFQPELQVIGG